MRLVRMAAAILALVESVWMTSAGAAEVKNVTAEYAWPWGAYINYEVSGTLAPNSKLIITATDHANNLVHTAESDALSGDTGWDEGAHRVVWELDKQGVVIQSTNVVFTVEYEEPPLYCVVNLSAGANASSYPVTYLYEPTGGFNTDEYKTTKLVLRRIEPGTFTMGSPSGERWHRSDETQHPVTLTKPYYIGVFEVTQKQWQLVMGSNPSEFSGDKRPVEKVSWNTIRGNFITRLRTRTGLRDFDLPTEAQWEYACRAGTMTAFSYGDNENSDYMWYFGNSTHNVGRKKPNPWGLYDMHGNVWEWCLDWWGQYGTAAVTDPKGPSSGSERILRGGFWGNDAGLCRSAERSSEIPSDSYSTIGFRLSRTLSE